MKKSVAILLAASLLLAAAPRAQKRAPEIGEPSFPGPIHHVILVSIDGLMPASYTQADAHGLKVPTLREMMRDGSYSEGARSVLPTLTYPAHTTIATGVNPGTHGILTNGAWDPSEKNQGGWRWYAEDIRVPTLWDVARDRGLRTALVSWPATVGAQATALLPEYWRASTPDDVKLVRALATRGILDETAKQFPDFYAGFTPPSTKDESLTDIAVYLLESLRPHLLLLHIFQVDDEEHEKGPFSAEADAAIEVADAQIARLIAAAKSAGIWEHTALVVVSDHGFAPISQVVRPGVLLRRKGLITLDEKGHVTDWKAVVLSASGMAYLYVHDRNDAITRKTLLETFSPLAGQPGSGIRRVIAHEEIVAMGGDPEAFLALEAADGFTIARGYAGDLIGPSDTAGMHGYFPDRPEMQASLLVYGPAIETGKITNARLIDVAPTVARWLGLKLEKAEGVPLLVSIRNVAR